MEKKHIFKISLSILLVFASLILAYRAYSLRQKAEWSVAGSSKAGAATSQDMMTYFEKLIAEGHTEVLPAYETAKKCGQSR